MLELFIYLGLAVGVSFICSVLEAVLLSTTFTYIETAVNNGVKGAENLKNIKSNMDSSIGSILTLNTIANTFGAAGVGAQAQHLFGDQYITLFSMGLTLLILYFSEIVPKTIGATYWKSLAIPSARVISWLVIITKPFNYVAKSLTRFISNGNDAEGITKEEILTMVSKGQKDGVLTEKEEVIVRNILRLKNIKVKDVLTPRKVVFALRKETKIADVLNLPDSRKLKQFSRIPIFHGSKDYIEGIVFSQTIFEENNDENDQKTLDEISIPVFEINENINLSKTLDLFIQRKEHMFIVKDGYSQTAGVITLEDVIETLLGREIMDELDTIEDMQKYAKGTLKHA
ncbi:CBS domain-containing protein [Thiovulum sp. ES]|nr:CBS domain-containing protein [Thiovulum sp. ES]